MRVTTNGSKLSRTERATLLAEIRALHELVHELTVPHANDHGVDLRRITPDQLLDAWVAVRGPKAEAHLLGRIHRRRAACRYSAPL
jgi:hypothetical protein